MRESLQRLFAGRIRFDEPLRSHTSFRIGGPADAWVEASCTNEVWQLQQLAAEASLPLAVMGTGTNVLVSDLGVRGIVVKLGPALATLSWREEEGRGQVRVGAGAPFKKLVTEAARRGYGGLEFAEGIPGSVGGGLLMNAGAFGGELSHVVEGIVVADPAVGERYLGRSELRFSYRRFDLPTRLIVTHVDFGLERTGPEAVRARMADAKGRREANQPLGLPNAGSIFKNPPGDYAGRLIEAVGMKGRRVGDAMISDRHANFIVNVGNATAGEVRQLMTEISDSVWQAKAIRLVPEIRFVGDWGGA